MLETRACTRSAEQANKEHERFWGIRAERRDTEGGIVTEGGTDDAVA